jgi:alcohol dehydrogenase (cytochrome c)
MTTRIGGILLLMMFTACGQGQAPQAPASAPPAAPAAQPANVGPVTDKLLESGHAAQPSTWPTYGGSYNSAHYSPLDEIRRDNISRLRPAWIAQTGVVGTFENTPIVLGREMYVSTPSEPGFQKVMRLDSATGEVKWQVRLESNSNESAASHDLHLPANFGPNRGVAVYGDNVYLGTLNGTLLALKRESGERVFEVKTLSTLLTAAPLAARNLIIIGNSFIDRGAMQAFDAQTGKLAWTWYSLPSPEEGGWWGDFSNRFPGREDLSLERDIAKEKADMPRFADAWKTGGGATNKTPPFDVARGLLYASVGVPTPHGFPPPHQPYPGDMRWTSSLCALHIETGKPAWCYQLVPHDVWGAGGSSSSFLFDWTRDGKTQPAVARLSGMGNLYVFEREKGTLLKVSDNYSPIEETQGGKAGANVIKGGFSGSGWSPGSYSSRTGLVYLTSQWTPDYLQPRERERRGGEYGNLSAVNPVSGEVVWTQRLEKPPVGGVLATGGGLVFMGGTTGSFNAYDDKTGEQVWSFRTGAGCNAAPMTYQINGQQYVAIACGGHGVRDPEGGSAVVAFTLDPVTAQ